jgi:hypothetical protein
MAKTRSNNRRAKASTRRKRGGIFGYDVRGKMAAMAGKDEDAFKPADMGMMAKANEMGQQGMDATSAGVADARRRMGSMAAPTAAAARGGRRRRRSTKKGKKGKKSKKSRKTRRRRH